MPSLGTLNRISDLRTIWQNEARDFTTWLAREENLAKLSNEIGIDIVLTETESSVGSFNVDIFATEEGSSRKVIIENQLEDTNHDHLGKIITYASGKDAEIIIWIVKTARDEHRQAIEWLNQHTDENIGFFLVEIELWAIDDSLPAPKFNVIERPNNWAKLFKHSRSNNESSLIATQFWEAFRSYALTHPEYEHIATTKPIGKRYDISTGNGKIKIRHSITQKGELTSSLVVFSDETFSLLKQNEVEINSKLNNKAEWRDCIKEHHIEVIVHCSLINPAPEIFDHICKVSTIMLEIISPFT